MSTGTKIFITGATGYIGGAVLSRLLEHKTAASSKITALVRDTTKVPKFESIGVKTLVGSLSDLDKLEQEASESDIVFACANADDVLACKAILAGLKKRHEATGRAPILIHTSGTGVLVDDAGGMFATDTIYDDINVEQLETLPDTQPHRNVDLLVIEADKQGYAKTHIILPSTIYSLATGRLVDLGIQNPRSIQIPVLIKAGLERGQGGVVGLGKNLWPNVHIDDSKWELAALSDLQNSFSISLVGDLYIVVYDAVLRGTAGHGREGLYFGENGEHLLYDVQRAIAEALVQLGRGHSPVPTPFTEEEYKRMPYLRHLGRNSRCHAKRARALGWRPRYTTKDLLESIKPEVEASIKRLNL
ncbi:NAD(P)-binding protein [Leucogyrophana mollusca]|uniref:NAD(P)-binding protein n=1 Tax=Leucogyrophana mollusca TaxID=85980 RepID=A0ACB8BTP1_9AGAM|nr:NAD(P)-binding protein [Leucogyrophana mollusca]